MSYQEFKQENCSSDPDATDYEKIGMDKVSGEIRYNAIAQEVSRLSSTYGTFQTTVDLGCGYGTMWKHYITTDPHNVMGSVRTVILTDMDEPALIDAYHDVSGMMIDSDAHSVYMLQPQRHLDALDLAGSDGEVNLIVSCGALDYYRSSYINELLQSIRSLEVPAVLEINLQSPVTPSTAGCHHLSIATLYDMLYENFLHDGASSVSIKMIKKYTAIVTIDPSGTKLLVG